MTDSWYQAMVAEDETTAAYFPSSALGQLLSQGSFDEGSGGAYDVGMATISSLTGQLQSAQDDYQQLESQLAVANTLNATLAGQVGSLERDLASSNSVISTLSSDLAGAIQGRDYYQGLYTEIQNKATDARPGTVFDWMEDKTYDIIDDRTTLLFATVGAVGGAYLIQALRPGIRSALGGGVTGGALGIVIAELLESLRQEYFGDVNPWNPLTWYKVIF